MFSSPRLRLVLLLIYLCVYLAAGLSTELHLVELKPLPEYLLEDFRYYEKGLEKALAGQDPYGERSIGMGFLYPPPALLLIQLFHAIDPIRLKAIFFTGVNLLLMVTIVYGVARTYGYSLLQSWYWLVLCLGFAPFLELLHIGQINLFTMFGLFLMFVAENRTPIISGLGLSLAVLTKVTPVVFFAYLLANRRYKVILVTLGSITAFVVLSVIVYGFQPLSSYPGTFRWLLDQFPLNPNSQSLVAKLTIVDAERFSNLLSRMPEILRDPITGFNDFLRLNFRLVQRGLTIYMLLIVTLSGLLTYFGRQSKEALFIVTSLAMTFSPNVMWYHHYVFLLLPLLVWMGWSKMKPPVVAWCLLGLLIVQIDRFRVPYGLWIHLFGQLSLLGVVIWQSRELFGNINRQPKGDSSKI